MLGVIPGSMADPAFVVRGTRRGRKLELGFARRRPPHVAHRRQAAVHLEAPSKRIWPSGACKVLSAGADEVPGVYKNIEDVMREQQDLVEIVARFDPKIVKMCGDGSRAED